MIFVDQLSSPRAACSAIGDVAADLIPRPWNRFEPDSTEWWLVPSSDWPAYRYGKLFFRWGKGQKPSILAGLYIEKGLSTTVREVYTSPKGSRFIMDDTWSWHLLLDEVRNGNIPNILEARSSELDEPIVVIIEGGYVQEPSEFDPYAPGFDRDLCTFHLMPNSKTLSLIKLDVIQDLLTVTKGVNDWKSLIAALDHLGANEWLWVDFFVGLELQESTKKTGQVSIWSSRELWSGWLMHLQPWLVAAG